jgi:hypothetical protein
MDDSSSAEVTIGYRGQSIITNREDDTLMQVRLGDARDDGDDAIEMHIVRRTEGVSTEIRTARHRFITDSAGWAPPYG